MTTPRTPTAFHLLAGRYIEDGYRAARTGVLNPHDPESLAGKAWAFGHAAAALPRWVRVAGRAVGLVAGWVRR